MFLLITSPVPQRDVNYKPSSEYHYDHVSALRPVLLLQVMVFLDGAGLYPRQRGG